MCNLPQSNLKIYGWFQNNIIAFSCSVNSIMFADVSTSKCHEWNQLETHDPEIYVTFLKVGICNC